MSLAACNLLTEHHSSYGVLVRPTRIPVPPDGPTDEELVGYYLRKKVASQMIDLGVIRDINLYRIEPWDLKERCGIGADSEEQNEWYFFSHKDKKYPTGTRTNRATMAGFWKATGRDKAVDPSASSAREPVAAIFKETELENTNDEEDEDEEQKRVICTDSKKVADWRALDKFVASQLSHDEDRFDDGGGVSSIEAIGNNNNNSDMALMLLPSDREERNKFNEFLNSSSDLISGYAYLLNEREFCLETFDS
ncbi:hypothetical protein V6N11_078353 [Hibiscus sabdariffa]|uniref:NAC domain-containing protein n=1 Tax=Hibiscus sabdariffa TaxID=183260 RepID=A0ABR2TFU5_9ROSI